MARLQKLRVAVAFSTPVTYGRWWHHRSLLLVVVLVLVVSCHKLSDQIIVRSTL